MEIEILYQDKDLVICVKPAGILSEEGGMPHILSAQLGGEFHCVHRLDKSVGGVMVYGRNKKAASALSGLISKDGLNKEYLALVPVKISAAYPGEGAMEDLLFHDRGKNKTYVVKRPRKGVKPAKLTFSLLKTKGDFALVKIHLLTGRTHQIRCQFASRGLPLLGDVRYGSEYKSFPLALWSYKLGFTHPFTGEYLEKTLFPSGLPWSMMDD